MNQTTQMQPVNRLYKSRIFAMLYSDRKDLLDLYNAVSGKHYEDPELLEINTLENAIYMSMHNDLSFLIDSRLSLYEHQSTYSPNLPLRYLFYISDLYSGMTKDENLYGTKCIQIPTPQFVIFYNGSQEQPDRPKGRGHHTIPTPVKAAALEYDIPVYQPLSLRKGEDAAAALETLRQLAPDLIVVLAYGQLLPKEVLELPKYRCINLHASLLPAYRGAAPIQWVILNGETKTGVTAQQMAEGLDTGDMLVKKEIAIGAEETAEELYERLSELCVETLSETLEQLEAGTLQGTPQDDAQSSYASRITKEMSALDFTRPAAELHNLIRGITGFTMLEGKRLKVYGSRVVEGVSGEAGTIAEPEDFVVACGDGNGLRFTEIQPEGKRRMATADFLRGKKLKKGEKLGNAE